MSMPPRYISRRVDDVHHWIINALSSLSHPTGCAERVHVNKDGAKFNPGIEWKSMRWKICLRRSPWRHWSQHTLVEISDHYKELLLDRRLLKCLLRIYVREVSKAQPLLLTWQRVGMARKTNHTLATFRTSLCTENYNL